MSVCWLGDPMKVEHVLHKLSVQGETAVEGKGKTMVLVKSNKSPVVRNGAGEPSNQHNALCWSRSNTSSCVSPGIF